MTPPLLKSPAGGDPVIVEGTFRASPERVFRAWTRPEEVTRWFGSAPNSLSSAEIDLRVGGAWRFNFPATETQRDSIYGTYTAIEPGQALVFSWAHERTFPDGRVETSATSEVSVTFEPTGEGTFVRLVHAAIRAEDTRKGVGQGWTTSFTSMAEMLDAGVAA